MQMRVLLLHQLQNDFEVLPELTGKGREGKYLVPGVAVHRTSESPYPYSPEPVYLRVEVLSPDYRFSEVVAKCEDYHAWSVGSDCSFEESLEPTPNSVRTAASIA